MAQIEWNGIVLNGTIPADKPIVDLSHEDLNDLIGDLFGFLSFVELCELYLAFDIHEKARKKLNWEVLFSRYNMNWNARTQELVEKLAGCEKDFVDWAYTHKMSAQDLMPLNGLKDLENFNFLSSHFSKLNLSRNEGKQTIDLLVDLIMLDFSRADLEPLANQDWIQYLYSLRNPTVAQVDKEQSPESPWPRYVQVQKQRQGDKITQKMQITFSDNKDLFEKLNRLKNMDVN